MWRSVFGDPQLAYLVQVKLNYWGMFPCSMAGPVGLSMGALPLHWQPGDFHFEEGGGSSFQTTFPYNSHCLRSVHWYRGAVSQSSRFNDVYVWGTSQDLARLSLVEMLCLYDCRPSSSIKGALNAFLPLACTTFIFPHEQHVGTLKTVLLSTFGLVWTCFCTCSIKDLDFARRHKADSLHSLQSLMLCVLLNVNKLEKWKWNLSFLCVSRWLNLE